MFNSQQRCLDSRGSAPMLTCRHSGTNTQTHKHTHTHTQKRISSVMCTLQDCIHWHRIRYRIWSMMQNYWCVDILSSQTNMWNTAKSFCMLVCPIIDHLNSDNDLSSHLSHLSSHFVPRTDRSKQKLCKQRQTHSKRCHEGNIWKQQADTAPSQRKCNLKE